MGHDGSGSILFSINIIDIKKTKIDKILIMFNRLN